MLYTKNEDEENQVGCNETGVGCQRILISMKYQKGNFENIDMKKIDKETFKILTPIRILTSKD